MVDLATWPTAAGDAGELLWEKMAKRWFTDGVIAEATDRMTLFADATGMQVKVKAGEIAIAGFHAELPTQITLLVPTADGTNDRIDRVVARLDRSVSPYKVKVLVVAGSPAGTPTPPALVNSSTYLDVSLGKVLATHGIGTIAANKITDERSYMTPRVTAPAGTFQMFFGTTPPTGYILMKGQTVNTADYPALAAAWGEIDATMVVPDFTDLVPRGASGAGGGTGGADSVTLNTGNLPTTHLTMDGDGGNRFVGTAPGAQSQSLAGAVGSGGVTFSDIDSFGSDVPFSIIPHHREVNFIVKAH